MLIPRFPELDDFPIVMTLELRDDEIARIKTEFPERPTEASQRVAALQPEVRLSEKLFGVSLTNPSMKEHPALTDFIKAKLFDGYDFWLLRVAVSLRPAPKTTLPSVRVDVKIGTHNNLQPTVYWVLPVNVHPSRTRETEAQIKPDLKMGSEGVAFSLGHWVQKEKIEGQDLKVIGYFGNSSAAWSMETQNGEGISGSWELLLVAEWPRNLESVPVAVTVSAAIHARGALRFTKRSTYRYDRVYREIS